MLIDLVMVKNILHIHGKNFITKEKFGYPPAPLYPYIPPPLFSWNFSLKSSDQRQNMKLLKYPFFDGFLEFKSKKKDRVQLLCHYITIQLISAVCLHITIQPISAVCLHITVLLLWFFLFECNAAAWVNTTFVFV